MTRYWSHVAVFAIAVVIALLAADHYRGEIEGAAKSALQRAHSETARWKDSAGKAALAVKHDSVRVTKTVTRYEELRDTLRLTDTVRVKEALAAADTAIHACRDYVSSCSLALAAKDSQFVSLERENAALQKLVPGKLSKLGTAAKWTILGAGIGIVLKH